MCAFGWTRSNPMRLSNRLAIRYVLACLLYLHLAFILYFPVLLIDLFLVTKGSELAQNDDNITAQTQLGRLKKENESLVKAKDIAVKVKAEGEIKLADAQKVGE